MCLKIGFINSNNLHFNQYSDRYHSKIIDLTLGVEILKSHYVYLWIIFILYSNSHIIYNLTAQKSSMGSEHSKIDTKSVPLHEIISTTPSEQIPYHPPFRKFKAQYTKDTG